MLEDWLNNPEPIDNCHEQTVMQMLVEEHSEESFRNFSPGAEQMMTAVSRHAVGDETKFQYGKQLEEAGDVLVGELTVKLLEEEYEERLSDKIAEWESAAEWQDKATRDGEYYKGDRVDLPICKEEVQQKRLHKESQPLENLDEIIQEIRRLMIRPVEVINKRNLSRE